MYKLRRRAIKSFAFSVCTITALLTSPFARAQTAVTEANVLSALNDAAGFSQALHGFHSGFASPQLVRTRNYCETMYAAEAALDRLYDLRNSGFVSTDVMHAAYNKLAEELDEEYEINFEDFGDELPCPPRLFMPLYTAFIGVPVTGALGNALTPGPTFNLMIGGNRVTLPSRSFLGYEPAGGNPIQGLFSPDKKTTGFNISGSIKFDTTQYTSPLFQFGSGKTTTFSKINAFYSNASLNQSIGNIDPGNGNRLIIPGPTGGASGFSLGGHPANIVDSATYSADFSKIGGAVTFGQSTHFPISVTVDFYGSAGYSHINYSEMFAGSVPGLARNFVYDSSAKVDQLKLHAGIALRKDYMLGNGATLSLGTYASFGPDFSWATGDDRLSFTGFSDSSTSPSASRTALGYSTGLSVGVKSPLGFNFGLSGTYRRETGLPVFERDGVNPTSISLRDADKWDATINISIPLYSDVRLKRDIVRLARLDNGLALYRYRYLWSETVYVGIMAQEVALLRPDAVERDANGFLRVDYDQLGLRMLTWDEWRASNKRWTALPN